MAFSRSAHDCFRVVVEPLGHVDCLPLGVLMRRSIVLALVVGGGLITACGDDDQGEASAGVDDAAGEAVEGHDVATPVADDARHVAVAGRSFAFEPEEVTVQAGEAIAIVLRSEDDVHDFTVDDLEVHVTADSGSTSIGGLQVDDPGRYTFYCSVEGHREAGMEGTLVVEG